MKVSELKAGQGKVDVEVKVKSKDETREYEKYGKKLRVANAVVVDDTGEIAMSLWNDDIDKVNVGSTIKISNGYVSEFNGQKQLTAGKYGQMEVIGGEEVPGKKADDSKENKKVVRKEVKKNKEDKIEDVAF